MDKLHLKAAREVNRTLQEKVRADWEYPLPAQPSTTADSTSEATAKAAYRERFYGTTDDSFSDDDGDSPTILEQSIDDMYAFDSPDTVGAELERKLQERKRKKRKLMEDEMVTNGGLRTFQARRNAWTGAVPKEEVNDDHTDASLPLPAPPKLNTSSDSSPVDTPTSSSSNFPGLPQAQATQAELVLPAVDVLVPIAEPLLPSTNPVRQTLSSRSQSELYEKVVRDSRTPAIPINLAEMMQIIVQGWKDEGNWPPRGGALPEPMIANRRTRVTKKVGMRDELVGGGNGGSSGGLLANHKHLRQSVEGVKKLLRLSGDHSPAGSRPGSQSHHSHSHSQDQ
jgi:hypothetical protein